ncbi:helix-turn-helix transcriptional regulator [Raoultibacter massiliensis]|uniref:helix-turn-helix transcriptional regulator n=1 Tax=Raoultibacter massiliensis TaxID=1852371 RepID=UPI003A90EBA8
MNCEATVRGTASSEALPAPTLALLICGLGFYVGWQTVGISPTLFPQPHSGASDILEPTSYLQTALFLVMLLATGWYAHRRRNLLSSRLIVILAAVLVFASTAGMYLCGWVLDVPVGAAVFSLLAASKAIMLLLWAECLCRVRFRDALLCVSSSYAIVFALCLLVAGLQPVPALVVHSLFPLISGAALLILRSDRLFYALQGVPAREGRPFAHLPLRLFIGIGLFGAAHLLVNMLSETKYPAAEELQTLIAGLALSICIALLATRRSDKFNFTILYRMLTPLIIVSVILVLTLEAGNQQYEAFIIGLSWAFFRIFTWTLWCSIAMRTRAPAACVFAVGQFTLTLCSTLAQLACDTFLPVATIPLPIMISAIIVLTVGTSAFVMSEGDVRRFFEKRSIAKNKLDEAGESVAQSVQCAAREYGLSKRESEIAELVMRGKNNVAIQESLYITESTLRTHLRNIYGKTSVHSRQELISLLLSYIDDGE